MIETLSEFIARRRQEIAEAEEVLQEQFSWSPKSKRSCLGAAKSGRGVRISCGYSGDAIRAKLLAATFFEKTGQPSGKRPSGVCSKSGNLERDAIIEGGAP